MKRDMDLIRRIVLAAEEITEPDWLEGLDNVDDLSFSAHARWLGEAGIADAIDIGGMDSQYIVKRLTWDGCNFADEIRSDDIWKKAKTDVLKPTMSFTFSVLREWLKTEIQQGLPTLRGGT